MFAELYHNPVERTGEWSKILVYSLFTTRSRFHFRLSVDLMLRLLFNDI